MSIRSFFRRGNRSRPGAKARRAARRPALRLRLEPLEERNLLSVGAAGVEYFPFPIGHSLPAVYAEYAAFLDAGGQAEDFVSVQDDIFALYEDKIHVELDGSDSLPPILVGLGFETLDVVGYPTLSEGEVMVEGYLPLGQYPAIISAEGLSAISATHKQGVHQSPPGVTAPPADPGDDAPTGTVDRLDAAGNLRRIHEEYQAFLAGGGQPENFVSVRDDGFTLYEDKIHVELLGSDSLLPILDGLGFETLDVVGYPTLSEGEVMVEGYLPLGQCAAILSAAGLTAINATPKYIVHQLPPSVTDPPVDPGDDASTSADVADPGPDGDDQIVAQSYGPVEVRITVWTEERITDLAAWVESQQWPESLGPIWAEDQVEQLISMPLRSDPRGGYRTILKVEVYGALNQSGGFGPIAEQEAVAEFEELDFVDHARLERESFIRYGPDAQEHIDAITDGNYDGPSRPRLAVERDVRTARTPTEMRVTFGAQERITLGAADPPVPVDEPISLFAPAEAIVSFTTDTPINDLEADDDWLRLSSDDLVDFVIYIEGLNNQSDLANAYSRNGGNDAADINAPGLLYDLDLDGPWS